MVSNASDDFPEPLGPVTTVNLPSGRSRSMPLRLFCRAPRTSTQPHWNGAVTHAFFPFVLTTGDYPGCAIGSQICGVILRIFRRADRVRQSARAAYPCR